MKKLFIATGYNSYTNKTMQRAFLTEAEADQFIGGLTDPHISIISYRNTIELINHFLKG